MPMPMIKLMAKTAARQRSRHREFRFRFSRERGYYRVGVRARAGGFAAELRLRPGSSDVRTFEQVFLQDFYNLRRLERWPEMWALHQSIAAAGARPLILDLGANIGLASLYLAQLFPRAAIVAVEPERENFELMQRNLQSQPRSGAGFELLHAAVASQDGAVRIVNPGAPSAAYRTAPAAAGEAGAVPAFSVASLLRQAAAAGPGRPFLAKIDIEGAEGELFSRHLEWVRRFPILMVEPHDWMLPKQGRFAPCLRALLALDRDYLLLGESLVAIDWELALDAATEGDGAAGLARA